MQVYAAQRLLVAETLSEYTRRLRKLGIKEIDRGEYGIVFQHPTLKDVVVKLLGEADPDYMDWIHFCQKNQNNPYVPKIHKVTKKTNVFDLGDSGMYSGSLPHLYLIFMEKLKPLSNAEFTKFGAYVAGLAHTVPDRGSFVARDITDSAKLWTAVSRQKKDQTLANVAKIIARKGTAGVLLDIHPGNIMKRGTQIVITDPFAS